MPTLEFRLVIVFHYSFSSKRVIQFLSLVVKTKRKLGKTLKDSK